jgi:hypothetical protein
VTDAQIQRFSRQIALPEVGDDGQRRILAAEVALLGADTAIETAALYLAGAGVQKLRLVVREGDAPSAARIATEVHELASAARVTTLPWPADGPGWVAALHGTQLAVRSGFDDDALLRAALRLGLPVIVMRVREAGADVLSFRHQGPCVHAALDVPLRSAVAEAHEGPAAVLAGTLAAAEALGLLVDAQAPPRARHLSVPLDGGAPATVDIPWTPECYLCGGSGRETARA